MLRGASGCVEVRQGASRCCGAVRIRSLPSLLDFAGEPHRDAGGDCGPHQAECEAPERGRTKNDDRRANRSGRQNNVRNGASGLFLQGRNVSPRLTLVNASKLTPVNATGLALVPRHLALTRPEGPGYVRSPVVWYGVPAGVPAVVPVLPMELEVVPVVLPIDPDPERARS